MINRVLIRMKVVQLLYSYMLTRSEFKIESAPESASRDKRYAYTLYLDLLLFILELSGQQVQSPDKPSPLRGLDDKTLSRTKMARSLYADDKIRTVINRDAVGIADFDSALLPVLDAIQRSTVFKNFAKIKSSEIKDEVDFWIVVIRTIIERSSEFVEAARKNPEFTNAGFSSGIEMVVKTLSEFSDNRTLLVEARNSLTKSLDKAYELYHMLLLLPVEMTRLQEQKLDAAKHKFLPSPDDLNPNTRFVDNEFVAALASNKQLEQYLDENSVSWVDDHDFIKRLLDRLMETSLYREYMESPYTDFEKDCEFWRNAYRSVILPSDDLAEVLESKSVYWNDDLEIMGTFVLKTVKRFAKSGDGKAELLPKYKDDVDARFGAELFTFAVDNREEYRSYIDKFINSSQWDPERLAFMDIIVMITAIAEILNFPSIPLPVSLNEYIEIANSYSTPRSGQFINGILFSVVNYLKSEGKLDKN